jgi:hypothetical protein
VTSTPELRYGGKTHMMSPRCVDEPVRWVCSLRDMHGTHVVTSPADGGSRAVTLGGRWLKCPAAAPTTSSCHDDFRNWPTPSRTPPRCGKAPPLDTPLATKQLNLARPRATSGDRRPMSPPKMLRSAPRAARRGVSSDTKRSRSMTTAHQQVSR